MTSSISRRTGQSSRDGKPPTPPQQQQQQQSSEPSEYGDSLNHTAKKPSSDKLMLHNEVMNHPNKIHFISSVLPFLYRLLIIDLFILLPMNNIVSVSQLYAQIDELRRQVAQRGVEIQASRQDLLAEVDVKVCA